MTEFTFDPDQVTVAAGQETTIVLTNEGDVPHEFMAGRQASPTTAVTWRISSPASARR